MINNLPFYLSLLFGLTTIATLQLFVLAVKNSSNEQIRTFEKPIYIGFIIWLAIQALLSISTVYSADLHSFPPKLMLFGVFPTIIAIIVLFATSAGRNFIDGLSLKHLTFIHSVRIPVEIVLFMLFVNKVVPEIMTFEGRNYDIIAGITAPIVAYFGIVKSKFPRTIIIFWNVICLGLLLNIVITAIFSTPSPMQKFGFEQPNIAIFYFPYSWLPTYIVPIVLFAHLASLRQLFINKTNKPNEQL
ncbi:MAG: hypothetical protein JNL36_00485 [Candidatus Kapabacteria bacterium]|nr:hypothetical protein [Candidatus Kapabacteria bacterium]